VTESSFTNITRQRSILLRWIIGLTLLALLLAGIALALRGPVAAGVDDGTSPAGHIEEQTEEEKNEVPRSLRQYAAAPRLLLESGRVDSLQRMC
jgi:hypothetical protein